MRDKLASVQNFVKRHKTQLLTTGLLVTTSVAVAQHYGIKDLNEFLKEHDLYDTYYAQYEEE